MRDTAGRREIGSAEACPDPVHSPLANPQMEKAGSSRPSTFRWSRSDRRALLAATILLNNANDA